MRRSFDDAEVSGPAAIPGCLGSTSRSDPVTTGVRKTLSRNQVKPKRAAPVRDNSHDHGEGKPQENRADSEDVREVVVVHARLRR